MLIEVKCIKIIMDGALIVYENIVKEMAGINKLSPITSEYSFGWAGDVCKLSLELHHGECRKWSTNEGSGIVKVLTDLKITEAFRELRNKGQLEPIKPPRIGHDQNPIVKMIGLEVLNNWR